MLYRFWGGGGGGVSGRRVYGGCGFVSRQNAHLGVKQMIIPIRYVVQLQPVCGRLARRRELVDIVLRIKVSAERKRNASDRADIRFASDLYGTVGDHDVCLGDRGGW